MFERSFCIVCDEPDWFVICHDVVYAMVISVL